MDLKNTHAYTELAWYELVEDAQKELPILVFEYWKRKPLKGEAIKELLRRKDGNKTERVE